MKNLGVKTYIYPQPVLILATYGEDNIPNAMTAAWGGIYDFDKVVVALSEHKTTDNLKLRKAFTLGICDSKHVVEGDYLGIVSGKKVKDKIAKCGLSVTKSEFVDAPVINEFPITIECKVDSFGEDGILIGKIINVLAREDVLGEDGLPTLSKFTPITFDPVHNTYVELGKTVGQAFMDGKKIK